MQTTERIEFRRVRDFSEVLNDTFSFIRHNFKPLGKSLLFIVGPLLLLSTGGQLYYYDLFQIEFYSLFSDLDGLFEMVPWWLGFFALYLVVWSVLFLVVYEYLLLYIDKGNAGVQVEEVWQGVKQDFAVMFSTNIGIVVALVLGFLLLVIPGIYLFVVLSIVPVVRLYEGKSFFAAVFRARQLMSGHWWATLGLVLVLYIIQMVFGFVFGLPNMVLGFIVTFTGGNPVGLGDYPILSVITHVFASLGYFTHSLFVIGFAFQFFNLVERKEAAGLMAKVESLGQDETE